MGNFFDAEQNVKKDESLLEWLISWQNGPKPIDSAGGGGAPEWTEEAGWYHGEAAAASPRPQPSTVTPSAGTGQEMALEFMSQHLGDSCLVPASTTQ